MVLLNPIDMICVSIIIKTRGSFIHSVKGYEPIALRGETAVSCLQLCKSMISVRARMNCNTLFSVIQITILSITALILALLILKVFKLFQSW